ncbi:MAG: TetR/AcrR family transcriptional regulator [Saprospiraceae bacterium]|nr:TetR/AcrR family transcriptional regulator [Saprospiraceae bacterium]
MTKQKIQDMAIALFNQYGYGGASMRDIAHKAGIEAASIYNHFASKQDLLHHICSRVLGELTDAVSESVNQQKQATAQLEAFLEAHIRYQLDNWTALQVTFIENKHLEGALDRSFKKQLKGLEDLLADILRRGMASRKIANHDPEMACQTLLAALRWRHQAQGKGLRLMEERADSVVRLLVDGLLRR